MMHRGWLALVIATAVCTGADLRLRVDATPACPEASPMRLVLSEVELPRNQAVTFRAYVKIEDGAEQYFGLTSLLAESKDAVGTRTMPSLRITAVPSYRGTFERKSPLDFVVRAFGGKKALPDLTWKASGARFVCGDTETPAEILR